MQVKPTPVPLQAGKCCSRLPAGALRGCQRERCVKRRATCSNIAGRLYTKKDLGAFCVDVVLKQFFGRPGRAAGSQTRRGRVHTGSMRAPQLLRRRRRRPAAQHLVAQNTGDCD